MRDFIIGAARMWAVIGAVSFVGILFTLFLVWLSSLVGPEWAVPMILAVIVTVAGGLGMRDY